ncbi:MAG: cupin domain-containing protein [Chitinophagaceae bacterium]|uniref:cupin domain-containing protein n=1 Tax=unclassified Paraflavitalea TaxID=2798305 RepID=UPI003D32E68D|nr:cupin domain-containing protein [Chitinophagaceae bacterium]
MKPLHYFIQNGLLEDYCLGLLDQQTQKEVELAAEVYHELKVELNSQVQVLSRYARRKAVEPHSSLEQACWSVIDQINLEEKMGLDDTPLINSHSDIENWSKLVAQEAFNFRNENQYVKLIKEEPKVEQFIFWTKTDTKPEVHTDEEESLLVLEGTFNLVLGEKVKPMKKGDFIKIPLNLLHFGQLTSEGTLLIVQRRKLNL